MKNETDSLSASLLAEIMQPSTTPDRIETLLKQGADINAQDVDTGDTPLILAVKQGNASLVQYLLEQGANPLISNHQEQTARDVATPSSSLYASLQNEELLAATREKDLGKVKTLLEEGANVNYQDHTGCTALMIAVEQEELELVEFFVLNKANDLLTRKDGKDSKILLKIM